MHHRPRRGHEIWLADVMAFFLLLYDTTNVVFELLIGCTPLHLRVQVMVPDGEQACADLAVGGNADAAAVSAKGVGHWRNDADLPNTIVEAVAACGLGARVRNFHEWAIFSHPFQDFGECHHNVRRPDSVFLERHELDE